MDGGRGAGRESLAGALFLAPSLLLLGPFVYYPLLSGAYVSLTSWDIVSPVRPFVGLQNYQQLVADPRFAQTLRNTALYSVSVVAANVLLGLGLALLLDGRLAGRGFYRTVVFAPYVTTTSAIALVWAWVFDPQYGPVNGALRALALPAPGWLASADWALATLVIMAVWQNVGYNAVVFLVGLQRLPPDLREAARIDGANGPRLFWHVTLPLLSPTTFFLVVTGLIVSFQAFDAVAVMTQGGPLNSTNVLVYYLYQHAFRFFEFGYASAVAMVLFMLVLALTAIQVAAARRWVHYG